MKKIIFTTIIAAIASSAALASPSTLTVTNQISSAPPVTLTFGAFTDNSATFCKQPETKTAAPNNAVTFSFDPKTYCGNLPVTKLAIVATKSTPSNTTSIAAAGSLINISNPDAACTANGNVSSSDGGVVINLDVGDSQGCSASPLNATNIPTSATPTGMETTPSIPTAPATVPVTPSSGAIQ
jgi:hypothetical protein